MEHEDQPSRIIPMADPPRRRGASAVSPQLLGGGRYELCEFVSKGGMGAVYRAHDTELDRPVAVKCLLAADQNQSRERAIKEARILAALQHPNILRVYDILDDGQQVWIVSEWVEGRCLSQIGFRMSPPLVIAIMAQIYDALAAAHDANIFHRDIKPTNVMVGANGRVTLIDFGVAFAPSMSTGETLAGSLRYTDPRILEGKPPDAFSDLFSAGMLQLELMTGETVLPDLAPLPLYRHIKKNLKTRVDALCDGAYPPVADLMKRIAAMGGTSSQASGILPTTAEIARTMQELLHRLTELTPQQYVNVHLHDLGWGDDAVLDLLLVEARQAIDAPMAAAKEKAAWIAFAAAYKQPSWAAGPSFEDARPKPSALEMPHQALMRGRRRMTEWWLGGVALVIIVLLASFKLGATFTDPQPAPSRAVSEGELVATQLVATQLVASAWAIVTIDGKQVGRLPSATAFMLSAGEHRIRLESPYIEPQESVLIIKDRGPNRFHFALQPKMTDRVVALQRPGRLFVNGVDQGVVTKKSIRLAYGKHEFTVKRRGDPSRSGWVTVGPDTPGTIQME